MASGHRAGVWQHNTPILTGHPHTDVPNRWCRVRGWGFGCEPGTRHYLTLLALCKAGHPQKDLDKHSVLNRQIWTGFGLAIIKAQTTQMAFHAKNVAWMVRCRAGILLVGTELKHAHLCFGYVVQSPSTHRLSQSVARWQCLESWGTNREWKLQRGWWSSAKQHQM